MAGEALGGHLTASQQLHSWQASRPRPAAANTHAGTTGSQLRTISPSSLPSPSAGSSSSLSRLCSHQRAELPGPQARSRGRGAACPAAAASVVHSSSAWPSRIRHHVRGHTKLRTGWPGPGDHPSLAGVGDGVVRTSDWWTDLCKTGPGITGWVAGVVSRGGLFAGGPFGGLWGWPGRVRVPP